MDWITWLLQFAEDPWLYLPLLFLYALLATVALPIPVELGLLNPYIAPAPLILAAALGKAAGGALVFPLGERIGVGLTKAIKRHPRFRRLYEWIVEFTRRRGLLALFALLCIPFMSDSAPVYVFTVFRRGDDPSAPAKGGPSVAPTRLKRWGGIGPFVGVNFGAALIRGIAFLIVPVSLGWP